MGKLQTYLVALALASIGITPGLLKAQEVVEKAGVGVGITAGNMLFLPIKAISLSIGALSGALSFVATGGDTEVAHQVWRDTAQGPYAITPAVARSAIGYRPEPPAK